MKRLIIICEGKTEKEFCDAILKNHFLAKDIIIYTPLTKISHGGIVSWGRLKNQIEICLKQDAGVYVTTFIDLYRLPSSYPNYNVKDPDNMQVGMEQEIDSTLSSRFIPYIQRHEFECFIFASLDVLKRTFVRADNNFSEIEKDIMRYSSNLEDINGGATTAPSERLKRHLPEYEKGLDGAYLVDEIGLTTIREKCPRFNNWIKQLEKIK